MPSRPAMTLAAVIVAGLWAEAPAGKPGPSIGANLAREVTIYRDTYGVPHVFGRTDAATAFGFGYAQAEDNFARLELNYIQAVGRLAQVEGPDGIRSDQINASLEIPRLAREEYRRLADDVKALVDGYVEGINYYISQRTPRARLLTRMEPWYPLAFIRLNYYQNGFLNAAGLTRDQIRLSKSARGPESSQGSNGWVVGSSRSASGYPLLFINPHLPFFGSGQVYEGHVHSENGWDFTGYTRLGFPLPYVGHNAHLGWVSTDNAADQADSYIETFDHPDNPQAYRYGAGYRTATVWQDTILVLQPDSSLLSQVLTLRKTHHGPLLGEYEGKPVAVRLAKLESDGWLGEWYAMTRARNLAEFKRAMAPLNMLFGNVMYADRDGHTWYLYNGAVPRRSERFDWTRPVDGSDPATEWQGYHTMDELPQMTDPATGWMQNSNSSPYLLTSTGNPDSTRFPEYMVVEGDNPRALISRRILEANQQWTWEEWTAAAFDTRIVMADSLLPRLIEDLAAEGDSFRTPAIQQALDTLRAWNHRADTLSVATSLFVIWRDLLEDSPGPESPEVRVERLAQAMKILEGRFGRWTVPWGEINRLQRTDEAVRQPFSDGRPSVAVPGVSGADGAVFTFYARDIAGQKARYGMAGASYVSVVEFGPAVRALTIHTFGASGDPRSPHYFDQAPLYAAGRFKPGWFTLAEVRANATRSYRPDD